MCGRVWRFSSEAMAVPGPISSAPVAHLLSVNASRKRAFIRELPRIRPADLQQARELLTQAVEQGGATELALVFLQRLGRLDSVPPSSQGERPSQQACVHAASFRHPGDSEESLAGNSRRQRRHHGNHPPRCPPHGVVVARVSSRGSRWRFGVARAASDRARCRAPHRSRSGAPR